MVVAAILLCTACGTTNSGGVSVNGGWSATLVNGDGTSAFSFTTSLVQKGNGSLTIANFSFSSNSPCFVSGETTTGSFTLSGDFNGHVTGTFGFVVLSG